MVSRNIKIRLFAAILPLLLITFGGQIQAQIQTVGVFEYDTASYEGYTLFAPLSAKTTYLIDNYGRLIHEWEHSEGPANTVYLLENGNLLRTVRLTGSAGSGGGVQIVAPDGTVLWDYIYDGEEFRQHHDIEPLPNGNVLILAWEFKTDAEAIAAGRNPALLDGTELWPEHIIEVEPTGPTTGVIVWEWHLWDHLIQDFDSSKENFGVVADHSGRVDINYMRSGGSDWIHANAIDYNPDLDQIVISSPFLNEFWIIDHSTTTVEASGHFGGNSGRGGEIIYRWGNPQVYGAGTAQDQRLFGQHDVRWIESGLEGAGNILVYNNGRGRPEGNYSTVDEIVIPVDAKGQYPRLTPGRAYDPVEAAWSYVADPPENMFSNILSGARRLPNGNTLICSGRQGHLVEITPLNNIVWEYYNPIISTGALSQGEVIPPGSNFVFRATRYSSDYPGLSGYDLSPGATLEIYPTEVSGTSHSPGIPSANDPIVVTTMIGTENQPLVVDLTVDTSGVAWTVPMSYDGHVEDVGHMYSAIIPPMVENTGGAYFIYVENDTGVGIFDPPNAPSIAYRFHISGEILLTCGDALADGIINVGDAVFLINYIFKGGQAPEPLGMSDANCEGEVNVGDVVYLINHIFKGGPEPCCP